MELIVKSNGLWNEWDKKIKTLNVLKTSKSFLLVQRNMEVHMIEKSRALSSPIKIKKTYFQKWENKYLLVKSSMKKKKYKKNVFLKSFSIV